MEPDEWPHFALECNAYWTNLILDGEKKLEMRGYPLPKQCVNTPILLVATTGQPGRPALPDDVTAGSHEATVAGTVVFDGHEFFMTQESFEAASDRHLIPSTPGIPFGWNGEPLYGWRVKEAHAWSRSPPLPQLKRLERSLFHVVASPHSNSD